MIAGDRLSPKRPSRDRRRQEVEAIGWLPQSVQRSVVAGVKRSAVATRYGSDRGWQSE
ncbi:MAG: hypothetical protein HC769_27030 [Cyanobacteria bacterium CRU_2_1]|nr:hypothetical protein [Cyanobacteria bacterium CRU_2_1]